MKHVNVALFVSLVVGAFTLIFANASPTTISRINPKEIPFAKNKITQDDLDMVLTYVIIQSL
jgi:hypothetical protein